MSTTQDFNRLGEELAQAYEHRRLLREKMQRDFSDIKKGTAELIGSLSENRAEMAQESLNRRVDEMETRRGDVAAMRGDIRSFLGGLNKTRAAMESARRSGMKAFEEERKAGVQDFLDTVRTEHQEMAAAWQGVLKKITAVLERHTTTPPQGETAQRETGSGTQADEACSSPADTQGDSGDVARLEAEIAGTLKGYPDGLKMTQVAEILGIAQWRMLIPIMRDLQDTGMIRKKGALYFSE